MSMESQVEPLSREELVSQLQENPLFDDKTWQLSPQPWPLTAQQLQEIEGIGQACLQFYKSLELLYRKASEGKSILRNKKQLVPWVAEYLDRGKPELLLAHGKSKRIKGQVPPIIRPDLLWTDEGFVLTELDSVPGGVGLTALLNRIYEARTEDAVVGAEDRMLALFYETLAAAAPVHSPMIAIVVSEEAATYLPEMQWLAENYQRDGKKVFACQPSDLFPLENALYVDVAGEPRKIDVVYRFWELFDWENIPQLSWVLNAWQEGELAVLPPMKPFQEEKMALALFHHPRLQEYWKESLGKPHYQVLARLIPMSWIVDGDAVPAHTTLHAPQVQGQAIYSWDQLVEASQKERELVLKISGFHEDAWGSRSVVLGHDVARKEWQAALHKAQEESGQTVSILQEFKKPQRWRHSVFDEQGELQPMEGRLRLCPYYFVVHDEAALGGALATFCPADKKIIHGMSDAALLPCVVREEED